MNYHTTIITNQLAITSIVTPWFNGIKHRPPSKIVGQYFRSNGSLDSNHHSTLINYLRRLCKRTSRILDERLPIRTTKVVNGTFMMS